METRERQERDSRENRAYWDEQHRIWAEINRKWDETVRKMAETDRKWEEAVRQTKETDRKWDESTKKWEESTKRWEESNRKWGELSNSIGDLTEALIASRLWEKFDGYPYNLKRAYLDVQMFNDKHEQVGEIDILLSNTEWVMPVEVKRKLRASDVEHHRKRMELMQRFPPAEARGKRMVGAVAGAFVPEDARDAAFAEGFFVIELTGDNVVLCPPPPGFTPKEYA
jgi:hypothetical protein